LNMKLLLVLFSISFISQAAGRIFGQCGSLSSSCESTSETTTSTEYQLLSAADKRQVIWSNIMQNTTSNRWFTSSELPGMFIESMCSTFQAPGDELPWEKRVVRYGWRNKYIHTVGTVGKVEWRNLGGHNYTGIFEGASQGVVRFSLAKEPDTSSNNTAPGIGLKFLRDGMDSANLVAMYSVDGQDSWNFFKNDFSNHIAPAGPALIPLAMKFSTATTFIQQVGLSDFGEFGESGSQIADPQFPFKLRFHPTGELMFSDDYVRPFTEDLTSIPQGSTLYEVWASDKPTELGGTEKHIADLVLVSEMTTSLWGDRNLFFRHQNMAEDVVLRPEWDQYLERFGIEALSGCPVARSMKDH